MQSWCRIESSFMRQFTLVGSCNTDLATPQQRRKWLTSWPNRVLYILCPSATCTSLLFSFVASLNWFFILIVHILNKKGNALPMQTSKSDIVLREWKQITSSQSTCTQDDLKYIWNNSYLCCSCWWKWRVIISVNFQFKSNWKEEAWKKSGLKACHVASWQRGYWQSRIKTTNKQSFFFFRSINWPRAQCVAS